MARERFSRGLEPRWGRFSKLEQGGRAIGVPASHRRASPPPQSDPSTDSCREGGLD